jgi:hypothetical protein
MSLTLKRKFEDLVRIGESFTELQSKLTAFMGRMLRQAQQQGRFAQLQLKIQAFLILHNQFMKDRFVPLHLVRFKLLRTQLIRRLSHVG